MAHLVEHGRLLIRNNYNAARTKMLVEDFRIEKVFNVKTVPYTLLALAGLVLLVKYFSQRSRRPKTWLKSRPRSPDPEKPTDVNTFADKKMKPTERPPGSECLSRVIVIYAFC
jgi:hypothetical protein